MPIKQKSPQAGAKEANNVVSIIPSHCPICEVLSADMQANQQRLADEIMSRELAGRIMGKVASATSAASNLKTLMMLDGYITKCIELVGIEG